MFKHRETFILSEHHTFDIKVFEEHFNRKQLILREQNVKGAQVECQVEVVFKGKQSHLIFNVKLLNPLSKLLIGSLVFSALALISLLILYMNNAFQSSHFLFKLMFLLPIFSMINLAVFKSSFDQRVKELSVFIQRELDL